MLATRELVREAAQRSRVWELLPRWRRVPLYRSRLPRPEAFAARDLDGIPFLTKRDLRQGFPLNFLPSEKTLAAMLERNEIELEHTSGTSDERTPVLFQPGWWDRQEERALRLNAAVARVLDENPGARRATLTTPACNDRSCPVVWESVARRTLGSTRFVNMARIPFVLSERELERMAREVADWSPQFLDVSPVHGVWFAMYCEQRRIRYPSLRFVLCSYEYVSRVHRRILERAFGVPVFNLYGSTETGHLLMEDAEGFMRPSYDTAFLELAEADERSVGDLVVTTLSNDAMPLLRYRIGDLVERREESYRTVYFVHGRARDALRRGDGRRVTTREVDECFAEIAGIAHYQLLQRSCGECHLRLIRDGRGPGARELKALVLRLEALLEPRGAIATEFVPLVPPAHSGKFRLTESHAVQDGALPQPEGGADEDLH